MQQRLDQLRALQASGGAAAATTAAMAGAPSTSTATATHVDSSPNMGYAYDDDDEYAEGYHREQPAWASQPSRGNVDSNVVHKMEEEIMVYFEQMARQANNKMTTSASRDPAAEEAFNVVDTDKSAPTRREFGDFEALRLAKMGDTESLKLFCQINQINLVTFADNHNRNALHYAADAGAPSLLRFLIEELKVPYTEDERHLTPLDIAILNGYDVEGEIGTLLRSSAKSAGHADGAENIAKKFEQVLHTHAPAPPKFVMSKPVPKAAVATRPRRFWAGVAPDMPSSNDPLSISSSKGCDIDATTAGEVANAICQLECHGRFDGLLPLQRSHGSSSCQKWIMAMATEAEKFTGVVVAQVFQDSRLKGKALKSSNPPRVAVAAHLSVAPQKRGTAVAAQLMHTLRMSLLSTAPDISAVIFSSSLQLEKPPSMLAAVKWYRRILDAKSILASDDAYGIYPEFQDYDEVLRSDAICKGAVPASLASAYSAVLPSWCVMDSSSDEACTILLQFIQSSSVGESSGVELACVPESIEELRRGWLSQPDTRAYARMENSKVIDFVVFRLRDGRSSTGVSSTMEVDAVGADVVYALLTSLKGTAKVDHMMLLAQMLLKVKLLYIPTLFGIVESDLAKSNFEELPSNREYLYVICPKTLREYDGLATVASSRVALPIYLI